MRNALLLILLCTIGCEPEASEGPPAIRFGFDECVHCGMIISDERAAAGSIVIVNGRRESRLFDDIGDMLAFHREHADLAVRTRYVMDYETKRWIEFDRAFFVQADGIHTPMGSGVIAFANEESAKAAAAEHGGRLLTPAEILDGGEPMSHAASCCAPAGGE